MTSTLIAATLARVLATADSPPPDVVDESVLFVVRHHAQDGCTPPDAGVPPDAAIPADAGPAPDAGTPSDAGASPDAGTPCMAGDAITMIVQPHISVSTDGSTFAVFYVTPADPTITLQTEVFPQLDAATGPKIVVHENHVQDSSAGTRCGQPTYGCARNETTYDQGTGEWTPPDLGDAGLAPDAGPVQLESVGPYDILRAHPTNRTELAQWLDQYSFTYATEDLDALSPYMLMGYTVVAARVKLEHSANVALKPLALSWPGSEIRVPVALSAARDQGAVLTVYIAGDGTYQFPSGTIRFSGPTSVMPYAYVTRSDLWINTTYPVDDPVAVHTTDENYQEIEDSYVDVKEPLVVDCEDHNDFGCCGDCNARHSVRPDTVGIVLGVLLLLRRKRRR